MQISPTRQKLWRVFRFAGIAFSAWSIVTGVHRLFAGYSSIVAPPNTTSIQLIRNTRTVENLRTLTKGMNVVPGIPISLADALNESSRSLSVWFADNGTVTMVIDRAVSDQEALALESFGARVSREKGLTSISNSSTSPIVERDLSQGILHTLFTGNSGTIESAGGRSELSIDESSITIHGFGLLSPPNIDEPVTSSTLFSASIPKEALGVLLPRTFTENTPGFLSLFSLASQNGISVHIHETDHTVTYTLAFPLTHETNGLANESALTQLAKEIVEVPTIEGITSFLNDGSKSIVLRSREAASIVVRNDEPYRFITATTTYGTAYITQTPTLLTVSNHIQQNTIGTERPMSCLSGATAFIRPQALLTPLVYQTLYKPMLLSDMLWHVEEVASTKTATRICITK